jgi:hypothetical protein
VTHAGCNPQGFSYRKQAHGNCDDIDAVQQMLVSEGEPWLTGEGIDPDHAQRKPEEETHHSSHQGRSQQGGDRSEGEYDQGKIFSRSEIECDIGHHWRQQRQAERRNRAGHERANGRRGKRRRAATSFRHPVALEGGDNRCRLTRGVQQDRGGRSTVHAAVVDTGKHNERLDRL